MIKLRRDQDLSRVPRLIEENATLTAQNKQLLEELEIVIWWRDVMEDGHDSREIL